MNSAAADFLHPRTAHRRWAWAGVALLHLLLLAFFLHARQSSLSALPKAEAQAQWVTMRLFNRPSLRPRAMDKPMKERQPMAQARLQPRAPMPAPANIQVNPSANEAITGRITAQLPALPPPEPAASSPEPLKLQLPMRQTLSGPVSPAEMARRDPRSNSRRPDVGERVASALGSPQQTEETIAPGHTRIREGSTCLDVQDARVSQLFAFDPMARGAPKLVSSCKK